MATRQLEIRVQMRTRLLQMEIQPIVARVRQQATQVHQIIKMDFKNGADSSVSE